MSTVLHTERYVCEIALQKMLMMVHLEKSWDTDDGMLSLNIHQYGNFHLSCALICKLDIHIDVCIWNEKAVVSSQTYIWY